MRNGILSQTFGVLGGQCFINGIILVYLVYLSISDAKIAFYLAIPFGLPAIAIFLAHYADRLGKKKIGLTGCILNVIGYASIVAASFLPEDITRIATVAGIIIYALGIGFFNSSWLALMNPIVPENIRGRFWGKLRLSWQTVSIAFALFAGFFLTKDAPLYIYQIVLGIVTFALILRIFFYARIPELEPLNVASEKFLPALKKVLRTPHLLPFTSYLFLLMIAMGAGPTLFCLIEKKALGFPDGLVVTLGALTMVGSVIGYWLGGKAIDRFGTKPAFLICHFGFGLVLLMFLGRSIYPVPVAYSLGILHCLYGLFNAVSSVAITTEMFGLIGMKSQSLSTAFCSTMVLGGRFLSGIIVSGMLSLKLLRGSWTLANLKLTQYDSILMFLGFSIILLIVTLGLVPSVMGKAKQPRNQTP